MFLKRLETIGFKSFAERVSVEFVPGITAIVGPNGSGKSNVIDAVRWVLGEQSAKSLRGQKMEDIIFQGSDTRKPLNFAEVTLVLNNENGLLPIEYQEVTVTRRVYRSGESEFFINKQPCRLKDIVDLFTDTGLGRESFSIIGQGKIDEILSSKADERRAVFDEAAGVMRYKKRKEEAAFKLKETEDNLSRVEDIIHEIEQQLEPLKIQSDIAKQYKALKKRLTEKEVSLLVTEIDELHEKWTDLLQEIENEKLAQLQQQTSIQQLNAAVEKKRNESKVLESDINELQQRLLEVTETLEQTEGKRNVLIEQQKHREENKHHLLEEKEAIMNELDETEKRISFENGQLADITKRLQQLKNEIKVLENKLSLTSEKMEEEIEALKTDYIDLLNGRAVLNNEQKSIEARLEQIKRSYEQHEMEHRGLIEQVEKIHQENETIQTAIERKRKTIRELERQLNDLNVNMETLEEAIALKQRKWYEWNEHVAKLSSRKEMLLEMKKNYQGFAYGVKEILQAGKKGVLKNIVGAVIDLIDVPAKYMTAVDTILGFQAQYIVVPDDETARNIIYWLKKEKKGRATFLPLQSIVPRQLPVPIRRTVENEPGFVGIASELVKIDAQYKIVADHLMGNVIVAETLDTANRIAELTERKYRIVTLEGDVVHPGGSISGGAQRKKNVSLFTREKELHELAVQIERYAKDLSQLKREWTNDNNQLKQLKLEIAKTTESLKQEELALQKLLNAKSEHDVKAQSYADRINAYEFQKHEYEQEQASLTKQLAENRSQLEKIEQEIKTVERKIEEKTNEKNILQQNEEQNRKKLHELELKNAKQKERLKNQEEKVASLIDARNSLKRKLAETEENLRQIDEFENQMEKIEEMEEKIEALRSERIDLTDRIAELQRLRKMKLQEIEDDEREATTQRKLFDQQQALLQEKEIEANRLDVMLENRLQTLQKQYTMTYEKAAATYEKVTNAKQVRQEVNELKNEINKLGTVNLGAIDEYERLSERAAFLNDQRNDLIEAKNTLYNAIKQMDEEMISRFKSTFETIQENFTIVFKQLFGGGDAELILTDPDNYLETGIDIVARPPGKKLKTLELLSGGERALTAIALLFAILRSRPVPFVILDEVDAALDEANVERFASYLKSFSKESQFVVISHRKGTMEQADALYGVTMQESGVSRFVSVKLEEADELVKSS